MARDAKEIARQWNRIHTGVGKAGKEHFEKKGDGDPDFVQKPPNKTVKQPKSTNFVLSREAQISLPDEFLISELQDQLREKTHELSSSVPKNPLVVDLSVIIHGIMDPRKHYSSLRCIELIRSNKYELVTNNATIGEVRDILDNTFISPKIRELLGRVSMTTFQLKQLVNLLCDHSTNINPLTEYIETDQYLEDTNDAPYLKLLVAIQEFGGLLISRDQHLLKMDAYYPGKIFHPDRL